MANKIRSLVGVGSAPMMVIYPHPQAARRETMAMLREDLTYGINKMGDYLKERRSAGVSSLPNLSELDNLTSRAKSALAAIDLPENESDDDILKRLGLNSDMVTMANLVRRY